MTKEKSTLTLSTEVTHTHTDTDTDTKILGPDATRNQSIKQSTTHATKHTLTR